MKELFFTHFFQHLDITKFTKIFFHGRHAVFSRQKIGCFSSSSPIFWFLMLIRPGLGVVPPECPMSLFVARWSLLVVGKNE